MFQAFDSGSFLLPAIVASRWEMRHQPRRQSRPLTLKRRSLSLRKDYSKLSAEIRELTHSVTCKCDGVVLADSTFLRLDKGSRASKN